MMVPLANGGSANAGFDLFDEVDAAGTNGYAEASDYIVDIREYDVPYHVRVAIDKGISAFFVRLSSEEGFLTSHRYPHW